MSQLLHNAAAGTALILAVAVLRRMLKDRLIPEVRLALWAVCLFRLLTPFAPESVLSLWGLFRRLADAAPAQSTPHPTVLSAYIPDPGILPSAARTAQPLSPKTALAVLWLAVGLALAARYVLLWRRTRRAVGCTTPVKGDDPRYAPLPRFARLREGAMDGAPLTFGAVRPTVVLSPGLEGAALDCVLAHEGVHARRRDNLWYYATALALAAFWWDPAVWLMARLLRRDVELSCDRAALRRLGPERRKDYALALVSMSTQAGGPVFCHTFGRKAAEERILSVMKFKKTSILSLALSLLLVFGITAAFASDPAEPRTGAERDDTVEYHGRTYNRADLSQGTLDWLDWYLSLSEEGQMSVSMVPPELIPALGEDQPAAEEVPESGYYYKDGDGKLNPIDPDTVSTAVTVTVNGDGTVTFDNGSGPVELPEGSYLWTEGKDGELPPFSSEDYIPLDPEDVDMSMLKEYLAKKVADGKLTQAEADETLANVQEMLEQAKDGDMTLWISVDSDNDVNSFCVSSYGAFDNSFDDVELPSGA